MGLAAQLEVVRRVPSSDDGRIDDVAVKSMGRLFAAWKVSVADAAVLAGVSERTWSRMKAGNVSALNQDQRMRASGLVGVYKGLHLYFSDALADRWVRLANQGALFGGMTPLAFMIEGGLPAILRVRAEIDALRGGM